jgi:hypothetical protein
MGETPSVLRIDQDTLKNTLSIAALHLNNKAVFADNTGNLRYNDITDEVTKISRRFIPIQFVSDTKDADLTGISVRVFRHRLRRAIESPPTDSIIQSVHIPDTSGQYANILDSQFEQIFYSQIGDSTKDIETEKITAKWKDQILILGGTYLSFQNDSHHIVVDFGKASKPVAITYDKPYETDYHSGVTILVNPVQPPELQFTLKVSEKLLIPTLYNLNDMTSTWNKLKTGYDKFKNPILNEDDKVKWQTTSGLKLICVLTPEVPFSFIDIIKTIQDFKAQAGSGSNEPTNWIEIVHAHPTNKAKTNQTYKFPALNSIYYIRKNDIDKIKVGQSYGICSTLDWKFYFLHVSTSQALRI